MGNQIYADAKLQYYPTSNILTMQILSILGGAFYPKKEYEEITKEIEKELKENFYNQYKNDIKKSYNKYLTSYICVHPELHKYYHVLYFNNRCIADLFAGEGEWLKIFNINVQGKNYLIGNELEENRYKSMIKDNIIKYNYNEAFEDLQLPKRIIDIMLFNPPYGESNGERNTRRYLKMILNREILSYKSIIVFVVKKDDILDSIDLITKYCKNIFGYKAFDAEYKKFKQVVLFAELKDKPYDFNNLQDVANYKEELEQNKNLINYIENIEYDECFIGDKKYCTNENTDVIKAFENFEYLQNIEIKTSKKDKAWQWLIDETIINDLSEEKINIPKPLKSGELANIIASGRINGELSIDGKGDHVVVGGVKEITTQEKISIVNKKGETETKLQTTVQNLPYLNLLINNNGNLEIKELSNNSTQIIKKEE